MASGSRDPVITAIKTIQVIPVYDALLSPVLGYVLCWQPILVLKAPWNVDWTVCQLMHHERPLSCHDEMHTCLIVLMSCCTVTMEIKVRSAVTVDMVL